MDRLGRESRDSSVGVRPGTLPSCRHHSKHVVCFVSLHLRRQNGLVHGKVFAHAPYERVRRSSYFPAL